ncbi:glycine oxidase ThiO [Oscillatoria sp. FACHB-1407]|nr:glycine oxidase ThiO [Oscillatoria sp. FACHB-1407]MBD2463809.1 glycine oxidase ThiO [Oscillatoria sp. FACHB-1407]
MNKTSDILIVGGGVVGLAIAVELKLRGATVTVLSRDFQQAASHAAAGMLAPQAEGLEPGAMLELSLRSRALYPEWVAKLEEISGTSTGYWACGILAPVYTAEADQANSPNPIYTQASPAYWLDRSAIHLAQPGLGEDVIGGWWFPEDGQVDNRALTQALRSTAQILGVDIQEGITVTGIQQQQGRVLSVKTQAHDWQADHYILATGAWSQEVLPVPVYPKKGQMLAVSVPPGYADGLPLQRVLYGPDSYIVPRRDGRIVIGATSESVGFTPHNTMEGIQTLVNGAIHLYPTLKHFPIQECWWGFRPATPDELPILGTSLCDNLTLAIGHYRNGILLTPVTAQLIADQVWQQRTDPLLEHFSWSRFYGRSPQFSAQPQITSTAIAPAAHSTTHSIQLQPASPLTPVQTLEPQTQTLQDTPLVIAGRSFSSRLMTGTGKYRNFDQMRQSITASGCQIVTVAVRRVQTNAPGHEGLGEALDWNQLWMLPNTAGCQTAEDAIRVARLGREMAKLLGQEDNNFVKLEVIPDAKYLLPDPIGTLQAAEQLVKEGFAVLPYINADPLLAKRLEEVGCATVMPLGSPIGSGQGIKNAANIQIIIENATVPVVVDAGIGTPSEAAQAMEMGADALLINTAIAQAQNPAMMGRAMGMATEAGRMAYLAGRIPVKAIASASSPLTGTIA